MDGRGGCLPRIASSRSRATPPQIFCQVQALQAPSWRGLFPRLVDALAARASHRGISTKISRFHLKYRFTADIIAANRIFHDHCDETLLGSVRRPVWTSRGRRLCPYGGVSLGGVSCTAHSADSFLGLSGVSLQYSWALPKTAPITVRSVVTSLPFLRQSWL